MIDRRKVYLSVMTPVLAGFVLVGSTFASSRKKHAGAASTQSTAGTATQSTAASKSHATAAPTTTSVSSTDIATAKSKGLVWVNTDSKVYHAGGRYYGKTKQGRFMTEADAKKAGYKAAKR